MSCTASSLLLLQGLNGLGPAPELFGSNDATSKMINRNFVLRSLVVEQPTIGAQYSRNAAETLQEVPDAKTSTRDRRDSARWGRNDALVLLAVAPQPAKRI